MRQVMFDGTLTQRHDTSDLAIGLAMLEPAQDFTFTLRKGCQSSSEVVFGIVGRNPNILDDITKYLVKKRSQTSQCLNIGIARGLGNSIKTVIRPHTTFSIGHGMYHNIAQIVVTKAGQPFFGDIRPGAL